MARIRNFSSILWALFLSTASFATTIPNFATAQTGVSPSAPNSGAHTGIPTAPSVPAAFLSLPSNTAYYHPYFFVVDKSARSLEIWKAETKPDGKRPFDRVAAHPADLGKNLGDKVSEGDHKTPEGIYFLIEKLEGSKIDFKLYGNRAYTTNYPNHFDDLDGKTGSGIWLHAVPDDVPLTRGSRGCVVVRNEVVTQLDPYILLGRTPIVISEKIETRSLAEMEAARTRFEAWLENWRTAWQSKSLDAYMAFYDDSFKSMGMTKSEWRAHKERLGKQYATISVRLSQPLALEHRDRAVVRFVQSYTSDQVSDLGEKTMHLARRSGEWKIISEEWRSDTSSAARAAIGPDAKPEPENKTAGR